MGAKTFILRVPGKPKWYRSPMITPLFFVGPKLGVYGSTLESQIRILHACRPSSSSAFCAFREAGDRKDARRLRLYPLDFTDSLIQCLSLAALTTPSTRTALSLPNQKDRRHLCLEVIPTRTRLDLTLASRETASQRLLSKENLPLFILRKRRFSVEPMNGKDPDSKM